MASAWSPMVERHVAGTRTSAVDAECSRKLAAGSTWTDTDTTELMKQWGCAFWPPHWQNHTGGDVQDGLQPVLQLVRDTSENRVAIVHLADNQCTNFGQQVSSMLGHNSQTTPFYWVMLLKSITSNVLKTKKRTFSVGRRQIIFICVFVFLCVTAWYKGTKLEV